MIANDFSQFMLEVHGHPPFPWQSAAVADILAKGSWPSLVDIPTGLGKTSMLDVAVFIMAMSAGGEAPPELGRRRIFFVVDRRIVVDQAELHGKRISEALDTAADGSISAEITTRLRKLSGSSCAGPVLSIVKMRGGTTWDAAWLPRPDMPGIITGTVDQVGSRLFFRGYGVSARRRPIDAALVGTDSVIMIDEAHLAQALSSSLEAAHSLDSSQVLGLPQTSVIHLSATSGKQPNGWVTSFNEEAHLGNSTARRRLTASKTLTLITPPEGRKFKPEQTVEKLAAAAAEAVTAEDSRVLVVCNTVDCARAVHQRLLKSKHLPHDAEVLLLMGRSRPLDREATAAQVARLFGADRAENPGAAVLVATQTVEVGIDLDATALVTETASFDALVQRIGRLNRRGERLEAKVVVVEDGDPKPPVYGKAKVDTAAFLQALTKEKGPLDVSPLALRHVNFPPSLTAPSPLLPLLLPAQLDAWVRTSPVPTTDPPLDPYLHGIDRSIAPITVAWRDGLHDDTGCLLPANTARASLDSLPLRTEECVEVPLGAIRQWLLDGKTTPVGDVEDFDDDIPFGDDDAEQMVLRRAEGKTDLLSWDWVSADSLRPGDVIVAPAELGGLDQFGWNPTSTEKVPDISELASLRRGHAALRLDPGLPNRLGVPGPPELKHLVQDWWNCDDPDSRDALQTEIIETIRIWLAQNIVLEDGILWSQDDLVTLRDRLSRQVILTQVEEEAFPVLREASQKNGLPAVDEGDSDETSHLNQKVILDVHLSAVGGRADDIAGSLRLSESLRHTVVDAARWHDLGKVDPRFQAMLFGGDSIRAELADEPLAKSGMPPGDRHQYLRARKLSRLPRGARHESWSEVLVAEHLKNLPGPYPGDPELLCHLIASHHGHARPLLPPVADDGEHVLSAFINGIEVVASLPVEVRLSDADRFARLNDRYGRWGLALLEAIVRCADMTVSSEGS